MNGTVRNCRHIDYLEHMLEAINLACGYCDGLDRGGFLSDKKTQQAVILNLVVIGEAATKILNEHPTFVSEHAAFPWRQIRGMRNRLAHGYFEINLDIVWDTIQTALPMLKEQIGQMLDQQRNSSGGDMNEAEQSGDP